MQMLHSIFIPPEIQENPIRLFAGKRNQYFNTANTRARNWAEF